MLRFSLKMFGFVGTLSESVIRSSLSPSLQALCSKYPSVVNIPVQWGEQDAFGHL